MKNAHPPIFSAVLREHKDSMEVMRVARAILGKRPWPKFASTRLSDVVDGRFQTPNKHSEDL